MSRFNLGHGSDIVEDDSYQSAVAADLNSIGEQDVPGPDMTAETSSKPSQVIGNLPRSYLEVPESAQGCNIDLDQILSGGQATRERILAIQDLVCKMDSSTGNR